MDSINSRSNAECWEKTFFFFFVSLLKIFTSSICVYQGQHHPTVLPRLVLRPTALVSEQAEFMSQCGFSQKSTVHLRPSSPEVWKLHWAHPIIYFWPFCEGQDSLSQADLQCSHTLCVSSLRETPAMSQPLRACVRSPPHPAVAHRLPPASLRAGFEHTDRRSNGEGRERAQREDYAGRLGFAIALELGLTALCCWSNAR